LKWEVLRIVREDPFFVVRTVAAKAGVVMLYLLAFANVGLVAAARWRKQWPIDLAFWSAMAASCIFALVAEPRTSFLMGFIAMATLYGVVSVNHAIDPSALERA
jgi:hypothetical protein